ncbi:MAG TPA: ATP-binding cassette domain-containing protein [Sedimenticola sp.]|nr:ATP-binding cassette domain-containing protein [Sedimenticola sp.]
MSARTIFSLRGVTKTWAAPDEEFQLSIPRLDIKAGQRIAVLGQSGCGKSTLLDILAMTLEPTTSKAFRFEPETGNSTDIHEAWSSRRMDRLAGLRGRHIGYVLQTGGLLPFITVRENIELPRRLCGLPVNGVPRALAERLKIGDQLEKLPATLSVGQRQRVAVARALSHEPSVVLADEPTASLDPHTAAEVMELFVELAAQRNITLLVASHDWARVTELGLTRLHHEQVDEKGVLRSEFHS